MAASVKDLLAQANATVSKLTPAQAAEKMRSGDVLVVDVRDPSACANAAPARDPLMSNQRLLGNRSFDFSTQSPTGGLDIWDWEAYGKPHEALLASACHHTLTR